METASNQAMQLTASNGAAGMRATWMGGPERGEQSGRKANQACVYAWSVCRRERMLRGMQSGLAAADLLAR